MEIKQSRLKVWKRFLFCVESMSAVRCLAVAEKCSSRTGQSASCHSFHSTSQRMSCAVDGFTITCSNVFSVLFSYWWVAVREMKKLQWTALMKSRAVCARCGCTTSLLFSPLLPKLTHHWKNWTSCIGPNSSLKATWTFFSFFFLVFFYDEEMSLAMQPLP